MVDGPTLRNVIASVGGIGRQVRSFDILAEGANAALLAAGPSLTYKGAASYLADKAQESDYFRATEEYKKVARYAPYIGRTFQQVTWKENYAKFGMWCYKRGLVSDPNYFVKNPKALADYKWAWLGGIWYFEVHGIWKWANAGDHLRVSQAVNRGLGAVGSKNLPNHWLVRKKMYDAFLRAGTALLPRGNTVPVTQKKRDNLLLVLG